MVIIFEDLKMTHFLGTGFWDPGFHQIGVLSRLPGPYRARILRPWIPPDWGPIEIAGPLIGAGFWGPGSRQIGIVSRLTGPL